MEKRRKITTGKKINQDAGGNRELFWKKVSKMNGGKGESCNRIKDGVASWRWERVNCDELGRIIFRICPI